MTGFDASGGIHHNSSHHPSDKALGAYSHGPGRSRSRSRGKSVERESSRKKKVFSPSNRGVTDYSPSPNGRERSRSRSSGRRKRHHHSRGREHRVSRRSGGRHHRRRAASYSYSPSLSASPRYRRRSRRESDYEHNHGGYRHDPHGGRHSRSVSPYSNYRNYNAHQRPRYIQKKIQRDNREPAQESKVLGVFGLKQITKQRQLEEVYEKYGPIESVKIIKDHRTGHSRGFAFIRFENLQDSINAKTNTTGKLILDDVLVRVDYSLTDKPHAPTPGKYMGTKQRDYNNSSYNRDGSGGGYGKKSQDSYSSSRSPKHAHRNSVSPGSPSPSPSPPPSR